MAYRNRTNTKGLGRNVWLRPFAQPVSGKIWTCSDTWFSQGSEAINNDYAASLTEYYPRDLHGGTNFELYHFASNLGIGTTTMNSSLPLLTPGHELYGTTRAEHVGLDFGHFPKEIRRSGLETKFDAYRCVAVNHKLVLRNYGNRPIRLWIRLTKRHDPEGNLNTANSRSVWPSDWLLGNTTTQKGGFIDDADATDPDGTKWTYHHGDQLAQIYVPGLGAQKYFSELTVPIKFSVNRLFPETAVANQNYEILGNTPSTTAHEQVYMQMVGVCDWNDDQEADNVFLHVGGHFKWLLHCKNRSAVSATYDAAPPIATAPAT